MFITSNRDEHAQRPAITPRTYQIGEKQIVFPKDPKAGGTWYACDQNGNVAVLLNGAEFAHEPQHEYKRSRGLIVLEMISADAPEAYWDKISLDQTEPFTLILYYNGRLSQLRWDSHSKSTAELDPSKSYIWNSSTLYTGADVIYRTRHFSDFLDRNEVITKNAVLDFHRQTTLNDQEGFVISRQNGPQTLSITQTTIRSGAFELEYHDLSAASVTRCASEKGLS